MGEVREFVITNSKGKKLDLMSKNTFGNTPTGLGLELSNSYFQAYGSFIKDDFTVKQGQFNVEMVYGWQSKDAYKAFNDAVMILNSPPLTLTYTVPGVGKYLRDIAFTSMEKSEIDHDTGLLTSKTVFDFLSPWYSWQQLEAYRGVYTEGNVSKLYASQDSENNPRVFAAYAYNSTGTNGFSLAFPDENIATTIDAKPGYIGGDGIAISKPNTTFKEITLATDPEISQYTIYYKWTGTGNPSEGWFGIGFHQTDDETGKKTNLGRVAKMGSYGIFTIGGVSGTNNIPIPDGTTDFSFSWRTHGPGNTFMMLVKGIHKSSEFDDTHLIKPIADDPEMSEYPKYIGLGNVSLSTDPADYTWDTWEQLYGTNALPRKFVSSWSPQYIGPSAVYPYIYQTDYSTTGIPFVAIKNNSIYLGTQDSSGLRVRITADHASGPITNPSWGVYDEKGNLLQEERYVMTIPEGYSLEVSTDYKDRYAKLIPTADNLQEQDVSYMLDPTTKGFARVPLGKSRFQLGSGVVASAGDFTSDRVKVWVKQEWLVV